MFIQTPKNIAKYTLSLSAHGTFSKLDHVLVYKTSLKFKRIQTIENIFSHCNGIKLEISNRTISGKSPNIWQLNTPLNNNKDQLESILN